MVQAPRAKPRMNFISRKQSTSNKQGGEEAMGLYQTLLGASVSKELARCVLPVSGYTEVRP